MLLTRQPRIAGGGKRACSAAIDLIANGAIARKSVQLPILARWWMSEKARVLRMPRIFAPLSAKPSRRSTRPSECCHRQFHKTKRELPLW